MGEWYLRNKYSSLHLLIKHNKSVDKADEDKVSPENGWMAA